MHQDFISMPTHPDNLRRVHPIFPFEERGRRLLFVVQNAAFVEVDDAGWELAQTVSKESRVNRKDLVAALSKQFGPEAAEETVYGFEQLEVLMPIDFPHQTADQRPFHARPLSSLVLHVAHDCNLRCGYCYADFGKYGGAKGMMSEAMAIQHIDHVFDQLAEGQDVYVTFFGGEPLMNMPVVFAGHAHAKARAEKEGRRIAFGITTNGTLLTPELAAFFNTEKFTVTVSIDGPPDVNDKVRPLYRGGGSYEMILDRVNETGVNAIARVTLTKYCTDIARIVRHLVDVGFSSVGVSPVAAGTTRFDMDSEDLKAVLEGMRDLADDFIEWAKEGKVHPFSNIRTLVEQVGAGEPRGLPCGAGSALVAADNKGDLYACHRLVGEEQFKMGSLDDGIQAERRFDLLKGMHPKTRAPCESCWARYLCGGGCHHIAWLHSGQTEAPWMISDGFCDFLRDWYRLGLYTYARVAEEAPEMLGRFKGTRQACSQPQGL